MVDSDSLTTSGFSGTQTTLAGAFDPGASGNSIITSQVWGTQAILGTGIQSHVGSFRMLARINTGPGGCFDTYFRLAWRVGDGDCATNAPFFQASAPQEYREIDLGLITIPEVATGTQSWDGRVEAWSVENNDTIYIDYLILIPVEAGYGKARGTYAHQPGVRVGSDDFTSTTAGGALNARTAPVGGTWATSGAATDLVFSDAFGGEQITRSATGIRYAILGTSTYTNVEVVATAERDGPPGASVSQGVIARWTDANNYVRAALSESTGFVGTTSTLSVTQVVAGVATVLGTTTVPTSTTGQLSLVAFTSGRVIAQSTGHSTYTVDVISVDVATGGTLATGKAGIYDTGAATVTRYYDAFSVVTPQSEPIALYSGRSLEIRHDSTERESSGGDTWGRPASYRGTRLWINPAGDQSRTTRVAVKASRNDLDSAEDANLTDQIALTVEVVPRFNLVPRL